MKVLKNEMKVLHLEAKAVKKNTRGCFRGLEEGGASEGGVGE